MRKREPVPFATPRDVAFARPERRAACDGVSLEAAAAAHGTPLYVYSRAGIEAAYAAYDRAFAAVPHRICYALKANGYGALLKILAGLGAGADIVSGGELRAALRAGFPPERIVFAGVGKTDPEIALGLEQGIGEFNAESETEITRISAAAAAAARTRGSRCASTRTSTPARIPTSRPACARTSSAWTSRSPADPAPGARLPGIESGRRAVPHRLADHRPRSARGGGAGAGGLVPAAAGEGFALRTVDIGGGLGMTTRSGAPDADAFAAVVLPALAGLPLTLLLEPGARWSPRRECC